MNNESKIKKAIKTLKSKKHLEIIIAVIAVILMLVLYFSTKTSKSRKTENVADISDDYCKRTERELVSALASMRGVGEVKIVVNWESGVETVIAYATSNSGSTITTTPTVITSQGSSSPVVLKELYPKALGVIIICQGGENVAVKLDIINAVATLLDISQNKINVYAMK